MSCWDSQKGGNLTRLLSSQGTVCLGRHKSNQTINQLAVLFVGCRGVLFTVRSVADKRVDASDQTLGGSRAFAQRVR